MVTCAEVTLPAYQIAQAQTAVGPLSGRFDAVRSKFQLAIGLRASDVSGDSDGVEIGRRPNGDGPAFAIAARE